MGKKIKIVIVIVIIGILIAGIVYYFISSLVTAKDVEIKNAHFEKDINGNVTLVFDVKNKGEDRTLCIIYRLNDPKAGNPLFIGGNTTPYLHSQAEITIHSKPTPVGNITWEKYCEHSGALPVAHIVVYEGKGMEGEKVVGEWHGQLEIP